MRKGALLSLLFISLLLFVFIFRTFSPPAAPSAPDNPAAANRAAFSRPRPPEISLPGLSSLFPAPNGTAFLAWSRMRHLLARADSLASTGDAVLSAASAVSSFPLSSPVYRDSGRQCRFDISGDGGVIKTPCGLVVDSAVTVIGVVNQSRGAAVGGDVFGVELRGNASGDVVLRCNMSVGGNVEGLVISQNAKLRDGDWGEWESCPADRRAPSSAAKVDGLVRCNEHSMGSFLNGSDSTNGTLPKSNNQTEQNLLLSGGTPIVEDHPFTATFWAGVEGFHLTINGRHEASFAYRERLEPWLTSEVRVFGNIDLLSLMANGLPVSEELDVVKDVAQLRAPPLSKKINFLFIGVSSTGNNFKRRMAVRRSWMQYKEVRSGEVAVRFFTGLHKNEEVNYELRREAQIYGDIQIMPFIDYYNMITLKTIAISIFGTRFLRAKYIMKTDDDAFVRVDEVLSILKKQGPKRLYYGLISFKSAPDRDEESKWFISHKEWPTELYPPWAHGPGYIISRDIAKFIVTGHEEQTLRLFKLEDVAMGIWIQEYQNSGKAVNYASDERFHNTGCEDGYVLAHYQSPRLLLCLWERLQTEHKPLCCE